MLIVNNGFSSIQKYNVEYEIKIILDQAKLTRLRIDIWGTNKQAKTSLSECI